MFKYNAAIYLAHCDETCSLAEGMGGIKEAQGIDHNKHIYYVAVTGRK